MRTTMRMARKRTTGPTGVAVNLYLPASLKDEAGKAALTRYGVSLSKLVERLLAKEISLKRGLLSEGAK